MDRLQSLRVFVAVADAESFAGGARALGISAPSATRGVGDLEAALGTRLFTRTTRQVRLSEAGRAYLEDVRDILAHLQAADDAASGAAARPVGTLRITCPQEFGRLHVAPLITDFLDAHDGISAEIIMVDRVVNLVEEGFDVAVRIGPLPSSDLTAVKVGEVRRVICGSTGYLAEHGIPTDPSDLLKHRLVASRIDAAAPQWRFGADETCVLKITPRLTVSSVAASLDIARKGWGLTRALSYQIVQDIENGSLQIVLAQHEPAVLPVHLVHVDGRRAAAKVRAFLDFAAPRLRRIADSS
ncbi:LysR family transcriptional regulator [Paracoccus benzoatiresistens]|uniref:LysR family transcriptional regulator n=1 Tax=Paracoccus benzoatiresistens TaxID=2997341 RepID=A0ABT4JCC7_9RHOB|nr:LysR family transcriptional regulator [Paracoccus sp. EF6]MCZ0964151.1 LysR family transcriptional regulator [Paracoccus sp. EF6]